MPSLSNLYPAKSSVSLRYKGKDNQQKKSPLNGEEKVIWSTVSVISWGVDYKPEKGWGGGHTFNLLTAPTESFIKLQ